MRDAKPDRRDLLLTLAKLHPIWAPPHQAVRTFTGGARIAIVNRTGGRYEPPTSPTRLVYNCFDDNGLRAGVTAHAHPRPAGVSSSNRTASAPQA